MSASPPSAAIGARIPRRELKRLLSGHGRYIDDIKLPRMLHACFVRSPHPHAKVLSVDIEAARNAPGVAAVLTAADINPRCEPFVGVALHRPGHRSAPQSLFAGDVAVWQGQPVVMVTADSRAQAEDAAELVAIEWDPLPAVGDQLQAIAPGAPVIHASLGDNVAFDFAIERGEPAKAQRKYGKARQRAARKHIKHAQNAAFLQPPCSRRPIRGCRAIRCRSVYPAAPATAAL